MTTAADGSFSYDKDIPTDEIDVMIYINSSPFGAHLRKGATTEMIVEDNATFKGDNVAESTFFNKYVQAFFPTKYKGPADTPFVFEDYKKILDSEKNEVDALIPAVKSDLQGYYKRLADSYYNHVLMMLYQMDKSGNSEEIDRIAATVDPNSDEARLTGTLNYWYNISDLHKQNGDAKTIEDYMAGQFKAIDEELTNEGNKKSLWATLGGMYMMYQPSDEEVESFFSRVSAQMEKAPKVKEQILAVRESFKPRVNAGDVVPTDPELISPDGKTCKLSDLLGKSVVYIDIWATWCRPCVGEIPFMEKVVEAFKGNDGITFISISQDDNKEAWLKKIAKDQPDWQQYIFDKKSGDEFMNAMGINGIPRFLLIGKDGKFINPDAERPSNENIKEILNSAINK